MAGVYISFPFCRQKCTYCNFASGVFGADLRPRYRNALEAEIAAAALSKPFDTLYIGGGTPSLLEPDEFSLLPAKLSKLEWKEATLEAAPGDVTPERARAWADFGIDRVSLGVQSFDGGVARASGRKHDAETVQREVSLLREAGIERVNVDLIAGLARQTRKTWEADLDWVERLGVRHVSVYMLEADDESRLGAEIRAGGLRYGAALTPSEEEIVELYSRAVERLGRMGIERYEISNFAAPGEESLHNLKYWTGQPYLGFGADAHSFDGRRRWGNLRSAADYVAASERGEPLRSFTEQIEGRRRIEDLLMTGLRTRAGVALSASEWQPFEPALSVLAGRGWIERPEPERIRFSDQGVLYSNEALEELLFSQAT